MFKKILLAFSICIISCLALAAKPFVLISAKEAQLPAGEVPTDRGITRGPTLELAAPRKVEKLKSPIDLKVRFTPHGGAKIDPESVQVVYVKSPSVDLTERVAPHVSESGISISQASIPKGEHLIMVSVQDTQGRRSSSVFKLNVEK